MSIGAADPDLYALADQYDGVAGPLPGAGPVPTPPPIAPMEGPPEPADQAAPVDIEAPARPPIAPTTPTGDAVASVPDLEMAPAPPVLTGVPEQDSIANMQWQRDLQAHYGKREAATIERASGVNAQKAERDAAIARQEADRRAAAAERDRAARDAAQAQVSAAVRERADAHKDLEGANWADKHTGVALAMTLFGAIGAGLKDAAAAQLGQVGHAQNEGVVAIDRLMKQDYEKKKARLMAASDSLIEVRHGLADTVTNRLAAQNDLDAEFAAKYNLVQKDAEALLRRAGASDADIKQNAIVANAASQQAKFEGQIIDREAQRALTKEGHQATNALANAHLGLQERQIEATIGDRREGRYEHRREFDLKLDEKRKADEDRAAAAKDKAEKTSVRQNAVLGNLAEAEKAAKDVGPVSTASIQRLQTNEEKSTAAKHSAESGIFGSLVTGAARAIYVTPRGRYDDIPQEEQKKITAAEQVITHLTEMQQGKNIETLEQYRDRYSPYVPGLSLAEVRRREAALPGLVAEQKRVQDPSGQVAKRLGSEPKEPPAKGAAPTKTVGNAVYEYVPDEVEAL